MLFEVDNNSQFYNAYSKQDSVKWKKKMWDIPGLYHDIWVEVLRKTLVRTTSKLSEIRPYCDVQAAGQQSTVRRLFTAVAMQRNNGSDQGFPCGPFQWW
jgi:hypothetical protein